MGKLDFELYFPPVAGRVYRKPRSRCALLTARRCLRRLGARGAFFHLTQAQESAYLFVCSCVTNVENRGNDSQ